ncbi:MAG TPA: uroporphyrinogen decarboxylase family protein [Candidatus Hydrogenedentes bacterium]|nr:uroporphyrinogen decarboxylase family protein [Candidatus Hydrogenedentota bacterium]HQM47604.1 uroporphyrinogen decarboxylase family protein [Candidatus Hydrogenedentota bacterium]
MTLRERIVSVYRGETPDLVPYMLDLSHWFYHKHRKPWDLSAVHSEPETDLIAYHRETGAGFYIPQLPSFYDVCYPEDVTAAVAKSEDGSHITWTIETPLGAISRRRRWEPQNYAWGIVDWGVRSERDLDVLGYALSQRTYVPHWDRYDEWVRAVGDTGVVYVPTGYSAMGHLLNYWMGVQGAIYATIEMHGPVRAFADAVNANLLECVDMLARSPAEIIIMGDNFSSDIQPPYFFEEWSRPYYAEAIARLHRAGKYAAVHIDGRLRGALGMFRAIGADCADAVTPWAPGDLSPEGCREEAGPDMILSGGVPPNLWLPSVDVAAFDRAVLQWLELRESGPRLIANAGDQVPPGADESRIHRMRDLVNKYGRC